MQTEFPNEATDASGGGPRLLHVLASVLVLVFLGFLVERLVLQERKRIESVQHEQTLAAGAQLRSRLESELNANLHLAAGLKAYIEASRGMPEPAMLNGMLASLFAQGRHLRNIGLAPGNRLSYIFPPRGNERALGLYFPDAPAQWPVIERAIDERQPTLAGPMALLQGGTGLIYRIPVFLENGGYWGVISTVVTAEGLFDDVVGRAQAQQIRLALRGKDGLGAAGEVFLGDASLFAAAEGATLMDIAVPGGQWQIALAPLHPQPTAYLAWMRVGGWGLAGLLAVLSYLAPLAYRRQLQLSASLRQSKDRYGSIADNVPGVIYEFLLDAGGASRFLYLSPRCKELFGIDPAALFDDAGYLWRLVHPDDLARLRQAAIAAAKRGQPFDTEVRFTTPGGEKKWIRLSARPTRMLGDTTSAWSGIAVDITAQKLAELWLEDTLARFYAILGGLHGGILVVTNEGEVEFANQSFCDLFGLTMSPGELRGMKATRIRALLDEAYAEPERIAAKVPGIVAKGKPIRGQELALKNGRMLLWDFLPVSVDGKAYGRVWSYYDISALKRAEALRHQSDSLLRTAIEAIDEGFVVYDENDRLVYCNDKYRQLYAASADLIVPGAAFEDIVRKGAERGQYAEAVGRIDEWVAARLDVHRRADSRTEQKLDDGRWLRIVERKTAEGYIVGFRADVTELKQAQVAAEAANRAKSEFLSSMSHELRTPLNAILGFSQLMQMDDGLSAEHRDSVQRIRTAGEHLLALINELLDLARIEAGKVDLSTEPVALSGVVASCRDLIAPMAVARGIDIVWPAACDSHVQADLVRLRQVLLNLLSNAVKYNVDNGRAAIDIAPGESGYVRIRVSDTGRGIAPKRLPELFTAFSRLDAGRSGVEGTGIGLVITKRLVELMGGRIGVESRPGEGSTFWVDFRRAVPQGGAAGTSDTEPPPAAAGGEGQAPARTILYIEDNPTNLLLVSKLLSRRPSIELKTAQAPASGLEMARAVRPDLILLDINLPGIDGYEVLRQLRADPSTRDIPVLAVSANAMKGDIEKGLAAGFTGYITKPIEMKQFFSAIESCLGSQTS